MRKKASVLLAIVLASGCATNSTLRNSVLSVPPPRQASFPAIPEGGYTWQHLVKIVFAANPDYAAILAEARAEYYRYKSKTDPDDLRLSFEYSFLSEDKQHNQYGIELRLPIPNPFVNKHITRTGEAARRETETEAEALKAKIASTIYELVQEALIGERELSVLLQREQVLSGWAEYLKIRHDAHIATQADMRAFDIQRLRLKAAIQQAQFKTHTARRSLQVLVQIPGEQLVLNPIPSDWDALLAVLEDERMFIEDAFSRSAELSGANAAYEKACAALGTARAKQIPWFNSVQLSFVPNTTESINYIYGGGIVSSQEKTHKWIFGLNVNLPVFFWFGSEKKMAAAEVEAAFLRTSGIHQRIREKITGVIADLRETLSLLAEYQSAFDSIPEPARETIPDSESYYKLLDARLSASEYALKTELECAYIYSELLKITGGWE
jgi:outer membrane protein TolC